MDWDSSFSDISLQTANRFYTLGWSLSSIGAIITIMGVILLMLGTRVRDQDFEARAAVSEKLADELKKGNLNLQFDLERERSARLELAAKIAPRVLSLEHKKALIAALSPFSGQKIVVTSNADDAEANGFAETFKAVFKSSEWVVEDGTPYDWQVKPVGIKIIVNTADMQAEKIPPAAKALPKALSDLGLSTMGSNRNEVPTGHIAFVVGTKP